tara:strand:+ start:327 stop:545 length:219 start_codon:yes stop_codon:yes gene_type:complete
MGNKEKTEVKKNVENNVVEESANKAKEAIDTLRVQLKEHSERAEAHRTMATKAQGALEVLLQLHPQDDKEGM